MWPLAPHPTNKNELIVWDLAHDPAELLAWANERLAKHQRLSTLAFRDEFPRNALGKVIKRVLREELHSLRQEVRELKSRRPDRAEAPVPERESPRPL